MTVKRSSGGSMVTVGEAGGVRRWRRVRHRRVAAPGAVGLRRWGGEPASGRGRRPDPDPELDRGEGERASGVRVSGDVG